MKKIVKTILLDILFLSILVCVLLSVNHVFEPKKTSRNSDWPVTSTYEQFYQMDHNSIDVLFLGSSYAMNAFIPQEIYEQYGITSYNLASEQQSIFTSYYWLKEALNYQSPQAVILETRFLFSQHPESVFNSTEGLVRSAIDPMKDTSKVKWDAVNEIVALDESQSVLSYYLTNIRFHGRWNDLEDVDFMPSYVSDAPLYGYAVNFDNHITSYSPYVPYASEDYLEMVPLMEEYLNRFVSLCKERNIAVILVSVPSENMSDGMNNTLEEYASSNDITYLNYSRQDLYESLQVTMPQESAVDHQNFKGAQKMSSAIGAYLSQFIAGKEDAQFEVQREYYNHIAYDSDLVLCDDIDTYLSLLRNENYTILLSVKNDMVGNLQQSTIDTFHALGLQASFDGQYGKSYYAVISNNSVIENMQESSIAVSGSTKDGMSKYRIVSEGNQVGNQSSIQVDAYSYGMNMDGINIVVYDNVLHKVIDSVNLNTMTTNQLTHMTELARKR